MSMVYIVVQIIVLSLSDLDIIRIIIAMRVDVHLFQEIIVEDHHYIAMTMGAEWLIMAENIDQEDHRMDGIRIVAAGDGQSNQRWFHWKQQQLVLLRLFQQPVSIQHPRAPHLRQICQVRIRLQNRRLLLSRGQQTVFHNKT